MHPEALSFVTQAAQIYGAAGPVYEIGSRNINGSVRPIFAGLPYLGVDVTPGPDVDVVADATGYDPRQPPEGFEPATVVCCEVLEHAPEAEAIMRQACDVLTPGGLLIVTVATDGRAPHSAVDGGPVRDGEFYRNLSPADLTRWLNQALVSVLSVEVVPSRGDLYVVGRKAVT
jgi:methyltransferase family protein